MNLFEGKTILVVDDEEDLREVLAYEFELKGCQVLQAPNGKIAYELAEKHLVHAVVSDIRMPQGNGLELLDRLRQRDPKVPPVILISGFSDFPEGDVLKKGAFGFFSKPFDPVALSDCVEEAIKLH